MRQPIVIILLFLIAIMGVSAENLTISFSHQAGVMPDAFNLTIATNKPATIHYTLDGSTPTAASPTYADPLLITNNSGKPNNLSMINRTSPKWTAPLGEVQKATVVRAIAITTNETTAVKTATYIVGKNFTVPIFSITMNASDLFDYEQGIYFMGKAWDDADAAGWQGTPTFHPANYRIDDWEKPVHLEVFENGNRVVDQDMGIQISGQGSRARQQKSLRFYTRKEYGKNAMTYQFYPDSNITTYRRLTLRNADDDNRTTFIRDVIAQQMVKDTPLASENYRPAVVFINGEYWGLYPLREKANQHYLATHYGVSSDNVTILEDNVLLDEGLPGDEQPYLDLLEYVRTHDMQDPASYAHVKSQMDTESFARYYSLETYIANTDWPSRNVVFWRLKVTPNESAPYGKDGRWRWILHDADYAFGYNAWQGADYDMFQHLEQTTWGGALWRGLVKNEEFRDTFVSLTADELRTNFAPESVVPKIDAVAAGLAPEVPQQIARWTTISSVGRWEQNIEGLRQFVEDRPAYYRAHLVQYFGLGGTATLTISGDGFGTVTANSVNVSTPRMATSSSTYFQDVPITLTATPQPGKVFVGWSGAASGTDPTIKVVLRDDATIGATFDDEPEAAPPGAAIWVTRKYPATHISTIEEESIPLILEIANPTNAVVNITWSVDSVPVNESDLIFDYDATSGNHTIDVVVSGGGTVLTQRWLVHAQQAVGTTCYHRISDIPATCDGGTITQDETAGGRTITCSAPGKSLTVNAWDKPTATSPTWFEMYRQSSTGSGLTICLGSACIGSNGFAQANYPVCIETGLQRDIVVTTSPAGNVELQVGQTQQFSYTVQNPAGLPVGSLWYIDDVVIPEQEDRTTYDFTATLPGAFNLTVDVHSNETNVTRTWMVTVLNRTNGNQTNGTNQTNQTCYAKVNDLPVNCTGGTITSDVKGGCRNIHCSARDGVVQVQACEKTDSGGRYFEMYRTSYEGTQPAVCIGNTCLQRGWGYQKGDYFPVCMPNVTPICEPTHGGVETCDLLDNDCDGQVDEGDVCAPPVCEPTNGGVEICDAKDNDCDGQTDEGDVCASPPPAVNLSIAPWFPQGRSYVFVCSASGFTPSTYDFTFGDGNKNLGRTENNAYYTYAAPGAYNVTCTAKSSVQQASASMEVTVT